MSGHSILLPFCPQSALGHITESNSNPKRHDKYYRSSLSESLPYLCAPSLSPPQLLPLRCQSYVITSSHVSFIQKYVCIFPVLSSPSLIDTQTLQGYVLLGTGPTFQSCISVMNKQICEGIFVNSTGNSPLSFQ